MIYGHPNLSSNVSLLVKLKNKTNYLLRIGVHFQGFTKVKTTVIKAEKPLTDLTSLESGKVYEFPIETDLDTQTDTETGEQTSVMILILMLGPTPENFLRFIQLEMKDNNSGEVQPLGDVILYGCKLTQDKNYVPYYLNYKKKLDSNLCLFDYKGGCSQETFLHDVQKKPFPLKKEYNPVVPLTIFQHWHSKEEMPEQFKKNVQALKDQNPEFEHFLYDHEDCRTFLKSYFQPEVLETFEQLVPLAFQSDFWRYCVLYQFGGIYLDVKWTCFPGYKLLDLVDKEHFVLDLPHFNTENGLTPTLIVSRAKNLILLGMIQMIIHNVKNKNKGISPLYTTGSGLLGDLYFQVPGFISNYHFLDLSLFYIHQIIIKDDIPILGLVIPSENDNDKTKDSSAPSSIPSQPSYGELWAQDKIFYSPEEMV